MFIHVYAADAAMDPFGEETESFYVYTASGYAWFGCRNLVRWAAFFCCFCFVFLFCWVPLTVLRVQVVKEQAQRASSLWLCCRVWASFFILFRQVFTAFALSWWCCRRGDVFTRLLLMLLAFETVCDCARAAAWFGCNVSFCAEWWTHAMFRAHRAPVGDIRASVAAYSVFGLRFKRWTRAWSSLAVHITRGLAPFVYIYILAHCDCVSEWIFMVLRFYVLAYYVRVAATIFLLWCV